MRFDHACFVAMSIGLPNACVSSVAEVSTTICHPKKWTMPAFRGRKHCDHAFLPLSCPCAGSMVGTAAEHNGTAAEVQQGRPKVELVGHANFKRHNPRSDRFGVQKFHHVEFWCADATNTFKR